MKPSPGCFDVTASHPLVDGRSTTGRHGRVRVEVLNIPKVGIIIPKMGTVKSRSRTVNHPAARVAGALFTKAQQRVLGVLFGNPRKSFYVNEIIALAGCGAGAVHRELARLADAALVTVTRVGNQKHFQANSAASVYEELRGLVLKTSGLADVIAAALAPISARITVAFVFGSVAKGEDTASSDVDLMVISESLTHADMFSALEGAAAQLGRTINPTVYSRKEFSRRISENNSFVKRVLSQPKIWLIGAEDDLAA
jgi:predicted nucleotidyltransferase